MADPFAVLARLLLRSSAAVNDAVESAAADAFGLEALVNRCIRDSSRATELLESLDGESLAVNVRGAGIRLRLKASEAHLSLRLASSRTDVAASATVDGTPLDLLGLVGSTGADGFMASGVNLTGDATVAEAFAEMLRHALPDIEEALSGLIGDIPAHEVAGVARRAGAWSRQAGSALRMNTSEFLQEEARQLPPRVEVDAFARDVDRIRDDVERASQRMDRLNAPPPAKAPSQGVEQGAGADSGR